LVINFESTIELSIKRSVSNHQRIKRGLYCTALG